MTTEELSREAFMAGAVFGVAAGWIVGYLVAIVAQDITDRRIRRREKRTNVSAKNLIARCGDLCAGKDGR